MMDIHPIFWLLAVVIVIIECKICKKFCKNKSIRTMVYIALISIAFIGIFLTLQYKAKERVNIPSDHVNVMRNELPKAVEIYENERESLEKLCAELYKREEIIKDTDPLSKYGGMVEWEYSQKIGECMPDNTLIELMDRFKEEIEFYYIFPNYLEFGILTNMENYPCETFLSLLYFKEPFTEESEYYKGKSSYHEVLDNPHWIVQVYEVIYR